MGSVKKEISDQIAIVDFRFEDAEDGFCVLIRRKFGGASLFQFCFLLLFIGFGAWFLWGFTSAMFRSPSTSSSGKVRSSGPPICCFPFLLGFMALWLSFPLRGLWAWSKGMRGIERWTFGKTSIIPGSNPLGQQTSLPLVGVVRAGLSQMGGKWAVGISSASMELVVGPFKTEEQARRFEMELRQRRSEWFVDAAGREIPFGLAEEKPAYPVEPIQEYEWSPAPGGFDLLLRRVGSERRHRSAGFLALWLTMWLASEILVGGMMLKSLIAPEKSGAPPATAPTTQRSSKHGLPPRLFVVCWLTFWTIGGGVMTFRFILHLKTRERWRFREGRVSAGRNWQFSSPRILRDEGSVHARALRTAAGTEIELVSMGVSLRLGPFLDEGAGEVLVEELRLRRPEWVWC